MTTAAHRVFRYSWRSLLPDYAGGAVGVCLSLGLAGFVPLAAPVAWAAGAASLLFLVYFARTVCRQLTRYEVDETGIRAGGPLRAVVRWEDLRALRLDYYSTRRDGEGGWMQLRLRDARGTMRIDSALDQFADLVREAAREAARRGIAFDAATAGNLEALRPR